ncbi:MAG TPA: carboxymuconolactone decarboxylase family protein [Vicinamibacteria bacterium]|nr:carboxymuconolactone decarboxylase family protein [Vicinamibacteria bacterium]HXV62922.1 carboxymuconolactone decarboxylase family protein [Vicinamibacteria bacterium]
MAWIHTIPENEASGELKRQYDEAIRRAGKVYQIVKLQSIRPDVMRTFLNLYLQLMHGPSGLTRAEREMVATVVSRVNHCHY